MSNNGKALLFDERFQKRPIKDQLAYLHKLCYSQNEALKIMQDERDALAVKNKGLEQSVKNAETNLYAQKAIVGNMVKKANDDNQTNGERIRQLERKIGELGGDLNSMGD